MIKIISSSKKEEAFKNSFAAIAVQGTITLELALNKVPFFTVYKLNFFSYFFLKKLVYAKYITLINIIFDKPIVPELIQGAFTKENIVKHFDAILMNKKNHSEQIDFEISSLDEINEILQSYFVISISGFPVHPFGKEISNSELTVGAISFTLTSLVVFPF